MGYTFRLLLTRKGLLFFCQVAKHGSRSVSSLCGSADVLETLGIAIDLGPEGVAKCLESAGVGFMYAPRYHPAMKAVRPVRSALKVSACHEGLVWVRVLASVKIKAGAGR